MDMISPSGIGVGVASEVVDAPFVVIAASVVVEVPDAAVVEVTSEAEEVVVASEVVEASVVVVEASVVVVAASVVVGAVVASSSAIDVVEADGSSRTETVSVASSPAQPAATSIAASSVRTRIMLTPYHSSWNRRFFAAALHARTATARRKPVPVMPTKHSQNPITRTTSPHGENMSG